MNINGAQAVSQLQYMSGTNSLQAAGKTSQQQSIQHASKNPEEQNETQLKSNKAAPAQEDGKGLKIDISA
ncbi:MAG: hypothetical protein H6696_04095 [Deferribacteres bacterium]|nr:hypothetical protein [candidate division KSB1 bacterium]MCB9501095.1 hypothetical protein [Deferribacteres bacterium]